jgi:hypothetical protein
LKAGDNTIGETLEDEVVCHDRCKASGLYLPLLDAPERLEILDDLLNELLSKRVSHMPIPVRSAPLDRLLDLVVSLRGDCSLAGLLCSVEVRRLLQMLGLWLLALTLGRFLRLGRNAVLLHVLEEAGFAQRLNAWVLAGGCAAP